MELKFNLANSIERSREFYGRNSMSFFGAGRAHYKIARKMFFIFLFKGSKQSRLILLRDIRRKITMMAPQPVLLNAPWATHGIVMRS